MSLTGPQVRQLQKYFIPTYKSRNRQSGLICQEAHAGQSRSDFIHKLSIASKQPTANSQQPTANSQQLIKEANEVVSILTAILRNTKANTSQFCSFLIRKF